MCWLDSLYKTNCTVVTLVAMVCVSGYYGNSRVTFFVVMWLLCCGFWEAGTISAKEVRRSFSPSLHFPANFYHTPSPSFISPPLRAPSRSLTFNFSHHPRSLSHPHLSAWVYFSASPSLPLTCASIFHFFAIHFPLLLCVSVGFCPSLSLSLFLTLGHPSYELLCCK